MDRILDQAHCGPTFLKNEAVARLVLASMEYGMEIGHYDLHSWVIMPNHVHVLLVPHVGLARLVGSLKAASGKAANRLLQRMGHPFWQDESYDHLVRTAEEFRRIRRYIEGNPVSACLAATPEDYEWSSARRPARPPRPEGPPHFQL